MLKGFIYNGKSTESVILSSRLFLATFDTLDSAPGITRESLKGETTVSRPIANDYGVTNTGLSFTYALIKEQGKPFTDDEQRVVERWLTSPKLDSSLKIIDEDGTVGLTYFGKFISTEWKSCIGGWSGVVFTFEHNDAYPKKHYEFTYNIEETQTLKIECLSDELDEWVYPTINLEVKSDSQRISIKNLTDNSNAMIFTADPDLENGKIPRLPITIDCRHCILSDATTGGIIRFKDIGWQDIGNIYWLRLLPGTNQIEVSGGTVDLSISFDVPIKRVGGWMA